MDQVVLVCLSEPAVAAGHRPQIQALDHRYDEPGQVPVG